MSVHTTNRGWQTFLLFDLVEEVCRPLEAYMAQRAVVAVFEIPMDQRITADREALGRALHNLIVNAIEAMPNGGGVFITSTNGPHSIEIEVADTGSSLSEEELSHIFEASTLSSAGSNGWDLAAVREIAEQHGGKISAVNCPDGGVAFTITIPHRKVLEAAA